jgi:hypothetical protein
MQKKCVVQRMRDATKKKFSFPTKHALHVLFGFCRVVRCSCERYDGIIFTMCCIESGVGTYELAKCRST